MLWKIGKSKNKQNKLCYGSDRGKEKGESLYGKLKAGFVFERESLSEIGTYTGFSCFPYKTYY